jgi:hypothetical protein
VLLTLVVPIYLFWWHISFILIFLSRGDPIDAALYGYYLQFVFGPGLEVPSFIQLFAIVITLVTVIIGWCSSIASNRRRKGPGAAKA